MSLYKLVHKQLELIKENPFKFERDVQEIVENNLGSLFGFQFVQVSFNLVVFELIH